jgi:hypothetical protein
MSSNGKHFETLIDDFAEMEIDELRQRVIIAGGDLPRLDKKITRASNKRFRDSQIAQDIKDKAKKFFTVAVLWVVALGLYVALIAVLFGALFLNGARMAPGIALFDESQMYIGLRGVGVHFSRAGLSAGVIMLAFFMISLLSAAYHANENETVKFSFAIVGAWLQYVLGGEAKKDQGWKPKTISLGEKIAGLTFLSKIVITILEVNGAITDLGADTVWFKASENLLKDGTVETMNAVIGAFMFSYLLLSITQFGIQYAYKQAERILPGFFETGAGEINETRADLEKRLLIEYLLTTHIE